MADASSAPASRRPQRWFDEFEAIARELPGLIGDRVELLSLELHRAGLALAQIVALVVLAAIVGVSAWLAMWVGITLALIFVGLQWGWAIVAVLALHGLALAAAVMRIRSLLPLLTLPATQRHLSFNPKDAIAAISPATAAGTRPEANAAVAP